MAARLAPRFPPETLRFLRALKRNNRREWFNARKDQYEAQVRAPMIAEGNTAGIVEPTVARVARATGLLRFGCVTITPDWALLPEVDAIAAMTIQSGAVLAQVRANAGVVELVDTLALGASGLMPLGVRVPPPA